MSYRVVVSREGSAWLADVPDLAGAHTYAGNLVSLDRAVREAIALVEDLPDGAEPGLSLDWDFTAVDDPTITTAVRLAQQRRDIEAERHVLVEQTRALAESFVGRGWSVRDIASLLGVSPGRVSQLVTG